MVPVEEGRCKQIINIVGEWANSRRHLTSVPHCRATLVILVPWIEHFVCIFANKGIGFHGQSQLHEVWHTKQSNGHHHEIFCHLFHCQYGGCEWRKRRRNRNWSNHHSRAKHVTYKHRNKYKGAQSVQYVLVVQHFPQLKSSTNQITDANISFTLNAG